MHIVRALPALAAAIALVAPLQAKDAPTARPAAAPAKAAAAAAGQFRTVGWDDLLPKDWDPAREFKGVDFNSLTDDDPRAAQLLKRVRDIWDNAPANPAMQGAALRIAGYVVPLEESPLGLSEFLLVPHFGACIHTPPPPANQIIHVRMNKPVKGFGTMDAVWISGTMRTTRAGTSMGVSGYTMELVRIEPYSLQQR